MIAVLKAVNEELEALEINYEFGQMSQTPPTYPYWVGEYNEPETSDYMETPAVILTGFARENKMTIETDAEKIKARFKRGVIIDKTMVIYYAGSFSVPTGDAGLQRKQINLSIKYWKGD